MRYALIIVLCMSFTVAFGDWIQLGPEGGNLYAMAVAPSNDNIAYVAPYGATAAVHKSTNGGATWIKVTPFSGYVYALAVDHTNPDIVYATASSYVYRTTNGGGSWTSSVVGSNTYNYDIAVHPTNPAVILACGYRYTGTQWVMNVSRSTNSGSTWTNLGLTTDQGYGYSIGIDRTNPNNVYVGGYTYVTTYLPKVFKSTDGGLSFADISGVIPSSAYWVYAVKVHPTNSNIVYAGTYIGGIYRSTDAGANWTQASTYYYINSLATTRAAPSVVYAGGSGAVYKSTNDGASWTTTGTGVSGSYVRNVAVGQTQVNTVYAANNVGCYKSTSAGASWFPSNFGLFFASIGTMNIHRSVRSTIYVEFSGVGIYRSVNSGTTWTKLADFLSCGNICAIATHNTDPNSVLALEGSG